MSAELLFGLGALVLAVVLATAMVRNRRSNRNPINDQIGAAATKEEYRDPEGYNPEEFRKKLKANPDGTTPNKD